MRKALCFAMVAATISGCGGKDSKAALYGKWKIDCELWAKRAVLDDPQLRALPEHARKNMQSTMTASCQRAMTMQLDFRRDGEAGVRLDLEGKKLYLIGSWRLLPSSDSRTLRVEIQGTAGAKPISVTVKPQGENRSWMSIDGQEMPMMRK